MHLKHPRHIFKLMHKQCHLSVSNQRVTRLHWEHHIYLPPTSFIPLEDKKWNSFFLENNNAVLNHRRIRRRFSITSSRHPFNILGPLCHLSFYQILFKVRRFCLHGKQFTQSVRAFITIKIPPPAKTFTSPANLRNLWDPFQRSFSPYI